MPVNQKEQSKMKTIKVNEIKCEFDRKTTEEEIQARAESISGIGLIHSVKIQPVEDEKFKYQVVAGRKSFTALTQVLDKTELNIPEEVSFIEGDADVIAFAENDERTNLSLAEQVEKLEKLSERFGIAELASHLSHSPQWIAARIRLKELSDSWRKAMKENRFD
jgi:ParB family transcriptional regulator, chromosome partitioning protein